MLYIKLLFRFTLNLSSEASRLCIIFFVLQKQVDIDGRMDPVKYWKIALSKRLDYRKVKRVPEFSTWGYYAHFREKYKKFTLNLMKILI